MREVAVIVGSLRKESWNRKLALALIKQAPPQLKMEMVEIGQLPLYNQDPDDEGKSLPEWTQFRKTMKNYDAVLFVTPEYNRSVPAPLKNAIDVGSRPYGQSIWSGLPCAVISSSPGAISGFGANQHLRQCFVFLDMPCMQQPEAYLGHIDNFFNKDSTVKEENKAFLATILESFQSWVEKILSKSKQSEI